MMKLTIMTPKEEQARGATSTLGSKLQAPDDIEGGVPRRCTDVIFLIILGMTWACMTYLGIDAIATGDPHVLVNGIDYAGRICGVDDAVADKPKLYYIRFDGTGVCVESCPGETDWSALWACTDDDANFTASEGYDCGESSENFGVCLSKADVNLTMPAASRDSPVARGQGTCMYQIESVEFVQRCVFRDPEILNSFVDVGGGVAYLQEAASDVYTARAWVFGFGFCFSTILGFLYLFLIRLPGSVCLIVWGSITCIFLLFLGMGLALVQLAEDWNDDGEHTDTQVLGCRATGFLSLACGVLFLCLIAFLRKQIALANGIVKESARAIGKVKAMLLMPLLQCVGVLVFLVPWVIYSVYTASLGEIEGTTVAGLSVRSFEFSDEVEKRGWFLIFVFFWTTQFIVAFGQIVIALTIVKYYFTRDAGSVNSCTFCKSLDEGMRYHMGTAALGSLVIAIVKVLRAMLSYLQRKLRRSGNKVAQAILCCMSCFFWCLETCAKFVNKNAYVQVAIFSTPFCTSAKNAFWLIARNLARVGAVTVVTDFVVLLMKLVISLGTAGVTYLFLEEYMEDKLYSPLGPVLFAGVLAFFVASSFAGLLGMTTLTILQCFIADEEMFDASCRYARNDLREWVNKHDGRRQEATPRSILASPRSKAHPGQGLGSALVPEGEGQGRTFNSAI